MSMLVLFPWVISGVVTPRVCVCVFCVFCVCCVCVLCVCVCVCVCVPFCCPLSCCGRLFRGSSSCLVVSFWWCSCVVCSCCAARGLCACMRWLLAPARPGPGACGMCMCSCSSGLMVCPHVCSLVARVPALMVLVRLLIPWAPVVFPWCCGAPWVILCPSPSLFSSFLSSVVRVRLLWACT